MRKEPLITVEHLHKTYPVGNRSITAVHDVSLYINRAETLGLVGESGCGKTTLGRCLLRLEKAHSGNVYYEGKSLLHMPPPELLAFRKQAQIIFQDPYSSLNPRMTAGDIISEPLYIHNSLPKKDIPSYVAQLLAKVGLNPEDARRFPHEFSGGQRQRIGIARALALKPRFIVCDEPISALDVPIQAQIVNLLKTLQMELGLTYLFITHNLAMVRYLSDRIAVMYLGHLVELSSSEELYTHPLHPYTQMLLSSLSSHATPPKAPASLEPASDAKQPQGCPFAPRCPHAAASCHARCPSLSAYSDTHLVACHLHPVSRSFA